MFYLLLLSLQESYNLFMDFPGLQSASVTQSFRLYELGLFPDSRNCAAVFDRRDVVSRIVEHQRRDIDPRGESLIVNRLQHVASKLVVKHGTETFHDFIRQVCQDLKTRQGIHKPVERAEIHEPRRRREVPFY